MSQITAQTVPAISVTNLSHAFKGHQALSQVTFCVMPQTLHGFVGPNGAGKTTTLKAICTLLKPSWGEIQVFGNSVRTDPISVRRRIGFMPDHFSMYRQMTVFEYLDFFAAAYGLQVRQRDQVIHDVLTLTDMDGRRDDLISSLSRGMQQRVSLCACLSMTRTCCCSMSPRVVWIRARIELMEILRELRRMGKTVFISSHILSELAELCDSVTIIDRGQVKFSGPMDALLESPDELPTYTLRLASVYDNAITRIRSLPCVDDVKEPEFATGRDFNIQLAASVSANDFLKALLTLDLAITSFSQQRRHLNQAFMDLTTRGVRT